MVVIVMIQVKDSLSAVICRRNMRYAHKGPGGTLSQEHERSIAIAFA